MSIIRTTSGVESPHFFQVLFIQAETPRSAHEYDDAHPRRSTYSESLFGRGRYALSNR